MPDLTPDAPDVVAQAPQSKVGSDAFQRTPLVGSNDISSGLEQLGQGAEALAVPLAKAQATQDVAALTAAAGKDATVLRNADGTPYAVPTGSNFILGRAGDAYQEALTTGAQNAMAARISEHLTDLHTANLTNPQGFKDAADQFATDLKANWTPQIGAQGATALATMAAKEGAQRYQGLVASNATRTTEMEKQGLLSTISTTQNKMENLAFSGGMGTPEFADLQTGLKQNYDQLKGNTLYGVSPTAADSQYSTAQSMFQAQSVMGQVEAIYKRGGGEGGKAAAQQFLYSQIRDNPKLNLSIEEKNRLVTYGLNHLAYLTSDQKAQIDASRESTNKIVDLYASGKQVDPAVGNGAIQQAQSVGDAESVRKIQDYMWAHDKAGPYNKLTDEQRVLVGANADYNSKVALKESGGVDNPPGGNGGGRFQISDDTWNGVARAHPELGLTPAGNGAKPQTDPAQAGKAQVALTTDNQGFLVKNNIDPNDSNTYMAHFLGAPRAVDFIKAYQQNPTAPAASLFQKEAAANPTIFYKGGDPSQPRSLAEVYALQTQRFGGVGGPTTPVVAPGIGGAPTPAEISAHPFALAAYADMQKADGASDVKAARNVGQALIKQFEGGNEPQPATAAAYLQMAVTHPELAEQAQTVGNWIVGHSNEKYAEGLTTTAAGQAYVDRVATLANSGTDLNTMARSEALTSIWTKAQERLKKDQFVEATNRHWIAQPPAAFDFGQAGTPNQPGTPMSAIVQSLTPAMAQRGAAALTISSHTGNISTPAFPESELPMVKSIAVNGTVDQKLGLAVSLANSGMAQTTLQATIAQLGSSKETQPLAAAGNLYKDNPEVAHNIIVGADLMKADPKLAPNKDDFPSAFAAKLSFNDMPGTQTREQIDTAVQAVYAKASADANDTTGILNQARLDKAVEDVTGGLATHRGATVIGPWYGAGQSGLDAAMRTLTDADFAGARTTDGSPFPASAIKPSFASAFTLGNGWRLQGLGDGKYLVFSGADDKRQFLGDDQGKKFVLDLGAKRSQAERAGLSLAPSLTGAYLNTSAMGFQ